MNAIFNTKWWKEVAPALRGLWAIFATLLLTVDVFDSKSAATKWDVCWQTIVAYWAVRYWWNMRKKR